MVTKSKKTASKAAKPRAARRAKPKREPYLWEQLVAIGKTIPGDELAMVPTDLARNWHHYRHGGPKQDSE